MSNAANYSHKRNDYYNELDLKELKRKNSPFDISVSNPHQIAVPSNSPFQ